MVVAATSDVLRSLPAQLGEAVSVQIFSSADEALWEMRTNPPEALIAEVDLPGMTGLELAEIVPNFEVPTRVLLYSPGDDSAREAAEAAGVYRFLAGQVSPAELRDALHAAMRDAAQAAQAEPEPEPVPVPAPQRTPARPAAPPPAPVRQEPARPAPPREAGGEQRPRPDFTPARVVLPSMKEREAAQPAAAPPAPTPAPAPAPAPARGGLAARSKAAASRAEPPRPAAPARPAEPAPTWRQGGNSLVVTEQNINAIRAVMSQLAKDLGTQSVMLTDRAGMALVEVGSATDLPMMIVLPLLSTGFATTGEVARQLHEDDPTSVYIHEGASVDLYCFDVMQRFLLVLVFNKKVASSKIGAVWINAKRTIRELREAFGK
jgi:CheY-like chemotaxis protein